MSHGRFEGVLAPVLTPFDAEYAPHGDLFTAQCKALLDQGADGLAVFGTTSEANSMSVAQRLDLLAGLIEAEVPGARLMPGGGASALADAVALTGAAVQSGCRGVLVHPPFYYKGVSEDGIFAYYAEIIEKVGSADLDVYLYHIPSHTQVPITPSLIARLLKAYPDSIAGLKDSGGDWSYCAEIISAFPELNVFPGSEVFLLDGLRAGGKGCISATANVNVSHIRALIDGWETDQAEVLQARITKSRNTIQAYPLIPALKALTSHFTGEAAWARLAPPLAPLTSEQQAALLAALEPGELTIEGQGGAT